MKKLTLVLPSVLLLVGCSSVVEDKYYLPSYERNHSECIQWSQGECENSQELKIKVPECWRLQVESAMGTESNVCVPKDQWDNIYIGQDWKPE